MNENINTRTQSNIQIRYWKDFSCRKTLSRPGTKIQAVVEKRLIMNALKKVQIKDFLAKQTLTRFY